MRRSKKHRLIALFIILLFGVFLWVVCSRTETPSSEVQEVPEEGIPRNSIFISRWRYFEKKKEVLSEIEWEEEYKGKFYRGTLSKNKVIMDAIGAFFVTYEGWIPEVPEEEPERQAEDKIKK